MKKIEDIIKHMFLPFLFIFCLVKSVCATGVDLDSPLTGVDFDYSFTQPSAKRLQKDDVLLHQPLSELKAKKREMVAPRVAVRAVPHVGVRALPYVGAAGAIALATHTLGIVKGAILTVWFISFKFISGI